MTELTLRNRAPIALVLLAGLLVTGGLAIRAVTKPGVYYAQVQVLFLAPRSSKEPNNLLSGSNSLVAMAGTVGHIVAPNTSTAQTSPDVTLADDGIRNGWSVTLPNDGNQFVTDFDKPLLTVQAVAPTAALVRSRINSLDREITNTLRSIQVTAHVAPRNRFLTQTTPQGLQIVYVTGSPTRALGVSLVLGLTMTIVALVATTRLLARRVRREPMLAFRSAAVAH